MDNDPPLYPEQGWTNEERAWIAGYLLHQRRGTLLALSSLRSAAPAPDREWVLNGVRYYEVAEAYSRFLLWWIGYPVRKDQMYDPLYRPQPGADG